MLGLRKNADADRRGSPRRMLGRPATIIVDETKLECVVQDFSKGGAKVELARDVVIPASFYLYLPSERLIGRVELVWRSRKTIGVRVADKWIAPSEMSDRSLRMVIG